jgi:Tol biopolymer transport system component
MKTIKIICSFVLLTLLYIHTSIAQQANFIMYVSQEDYQVYIANSDGSNPQVLIGTESVGNQIWDASLSPDKTKIALQYLSVNGSMKIKMFDFATQTFYQVIDTEQISEKPRWSNDSSKLVFLNNSINEVGIYDINNNITTFLNLNQITRQISPDIGAVTNALFSLDDSYLLLNMQNVPVATIYHNFLARMNLDGTSFTILTSPEYDMRENSVWYDTNTVYGSCLITLNGDSAGEICKVDLTTNAVSILSNFRSEFPATEIRIICDLQMVNNKILMNYGCSNYYFVDAQTGAVTPIIADPNIQLVAIIDTIPPWFFATPTATETLTYTPSP